MESSLDFLQFLDTDTSLMILKYLDAPADLVCASVVSHAWQEFVIKHELGKKLSLKKYPQLSRVSQLALASKKEMSGDVRSSSSIEKMDHIVYTSLAHMLDSATKGSCVSEAICASSTDNYPEESIDNTLIQSDRIEQRASYWSSTGQSDVEAPESLIYKLKSSLCLINEIYIQPFQAYFQLGYPIYSSKFVRFRMGQLKFPLDLNLEDVQLDQLTDGNFVWNYTSPEFPMLQERSLQKFELPKPSLCIGGYLKIEFLGRVQKQEMDDKYYICMSHVRADGMSLSPKFTVKTLQNPGEILLEYDPHVVNIPANATSTSIIEFIDEEAQGHINWGQFVNVQYEYMNMFEAYIPGEDEEDTSEDEHAVGILEFDDTDDDGDVEII